MPTVTAQSYGRQKGGANPDGPERLSLERLPTITVGDASGTCSNKRGEPGLSMMAKQGLWPTPTVKGNHNRTGLSVKSGDGLATAVARWPTPLASDGCGPGGQAKRRSPGLPHHAGGPLNPTWVEWLMGWPLGWTGLEPVETESCRLWLRAHGASSSIERA